jgi:hypothetical protein
VTTQFDAQDTPALVRTQVGSPGQINPALVRKQSASPFACVAPGAVSTSAVTAIRAEIHL